MWWADVQVGDLDLQVAKRPGDLTVADLPAAVDLRVTHELAEGTGWPRRQGPSTAQVTLLCASAQEAAALITAGDPVALRLRTEQTLRNYVLNPDTRQTVLTEDPAEVPALRDVYRGGAAGGSITYVNGGIGSPPGAGSTSAAQVTVTSTGSLLTYYGLGETAVEGDRVVGGIWVWSNAVATFRPYLWGPRPSTGANASIEPSGNDTEVAANAWTWVPTDLVVPADRTVNRAGVRHVGNTPAVGYSYATDHALYTWGWEGPALPKGGNGRTYLGNTPEGDEDAERPYRWEWDGPADRSTSSRTREPGGSFYGRASDPTMKPHDLGVMVTVTCADYKADLGQETVGSADRPQEDTGARLEALGAATLGLDGALEVFPPERWTVLAARPGGAASLLQVWEETLESSALEGVTFNTVDWIRRPYRQVYDLRPNLDPVTGQWLSDLDPEWEAPWALEALDTTVEAPVGLSLALQDGLYRLAASADLGEVLPAGWLSMDATWAKRASGDVDTVDVVYAGGTRVERVTNRTSGRRTVDRRETLLADADSARLLGSVYLPEDVVLAGESWETERLQVVMDHDAVTLPWGWWPGALRRARLVTGLNPVWSPDGGTYWPGVVTFLEWRVAEGQAVVDLSLAATPLGASARSLRISAAPAGARLDNVDPTLTLADLALVGP